MSNPKRHHYLPESYLRRFANSSRKFWIFDRKANEFRIQTPKNTAVRGYYYAFRDQNGNRRFDIESSLADIENRAKDIINRLDERQPLTLQDRQPLAHFVALLRLRVPEFERVYNKAGERLAKHTMMAEFSNRDRAIAWLRDYEEVTGDKLEISDDEIINAVKRGEGSFSPPREHSLWASVRLAPEIADVFMSLAWKICHVSSETSLVTSDNPFTILPPSNYNPAGFQGVGFLTPNALKIIPLSYKTILIMGNPGDSVTIGKISKESVRECNKAIAVGSEDLVIARDETLIKRIIKITKLDKN